MLLVDGVADDHELELELELVDRVDPEVHDDSDTEDDDDDMAPPLALLSSRLSPNYNGR
jgi:hypothetical protein